jgi:hypothetical protein
MSSFVHDRGFFIVFAIAVSPVNQKGRTLAFSLAALRRPARLGGG